MEPVGPVQERIKRGCAAARSVRRSGLAPEQRRGFDEITAVTDEIPVAGEAAQLLHGIEIEAAVLEDFVWGLRVVNHAPLGIVADDGGAAEALENAELNFLGLERDQAVEPSGETLKVFTGQAGDKVGMDMDAGVLAEETEILLEALIILAALDESADFGIKGLNADFKLQSAGRKAGDDFPQGLRQTVRDHFEMKEETGLVALEKEFENGAADIDVQVEGAVDELELFHTALEEAFESGEQLRQGGLPDGNVQGGEAEFAGKGAAARGLDVNDAMGDVLSGIEVVGEGEPREIGEVSRNDFGRGSLAGEQLLA